MPRYLTISIDLQLIVGGGCKFISRSKNLMEAESEVEVWLEDNPSHARRAEAEAWLDASAAEIQDRLSTEERNKLEIAALENMQKWIRQLVRIIGRSRGWSREKIQQESNKRSMWASRLLNDDPDELIAELQKLRRDPRQRP